MKVTVAAIERGENTAMLADTMARRAARAKVDADADNQTAECQKRQGNRDRIGNLATSGQIQHRRDDGSCKKGNAPGPVR